MYIVTNRIVYPRRDGLDILGKTPNAKGPHEIRFLEASEKNGKWKVELLDDRPAVKDWEKAGIERVHGYASEFIARSVIKLARSKKKNVLFYVHGFNNDLEDILERAKKMEELYGVIAVIFTWPANGGGVSGVVSYKSDKRDARASAGALERTLEKTSQYIHMINEEYENRINEESIERYPENIEKRYEFIARSYVENCPVRLTLILHSMGNYVYKNALRPSSTTANPLVFDTVILAAPDVNNKDHKEWVDKVKFKNRLYILINEKDKALLVSRIKLGDEQLPRLGHWTKGLDSKNAQYINLTNAPEVGRSHAYFEDVENGKVRAFFKDMFNGIDCDNSENNKYDLQYVTSDNYFLLK
ncbi:MAG: alpha/beta hydrolase [Lentisphaeraceae bacterium]|nr:alpha/beta hydrolase [Lentisphaeraceae bacterium]